MKLKCNCCDGIYNSLDIHFTSVCDNNCRHCIDKRFYGMRISKPNVSSIVNTIINNSIGIDDVLFLGGEPCLYLEELLDCVRQVKSKTKLKIFVTTSVPKICYDKKELFFILIDELDGINISVQHYDEEIADEIRRTKSKYDRQLFYQELPHKEKIRINLNVVKPYLFNKTDITNCLNHYDRLGFNSIKLSEIQHGKDLYVSFSDVFNIDSPSAYSYGCQSYIDTSKIFPKFSTPLLLKRSCFLCEESLNASLLDGIKMVAKIFRANKNKYGVIYEDGTLQGGWI
jgi:molybdenum cofactor biosynthesis enzyme MoaA